MSKNVSNENRTLRELIIDLVAPDISDGKKFLNKVVIPVLALATVFYANRGVRDYLFTRELTRADYKVEACSDREVDFCWKWVSKPEDDNTRQQNIGWTLKENDFVNPITFVYPWGRTNEISERALQIAEKYVKVVR